MNLGHDLRIKYGLSDDPSDASIARWAERTAALADEIGDAEQAGRAAALEVFGELDRTLYFSAAELDAAGVLFVEDIGEASIGAHAAVLHCLFAAHRRARMVAQLQVGVEPVCAPTLSIRDEPAPAAALRQPEPAVFGDEGAVVISGRAGDRLDAVVQSTANDVTVLSALMVRTPYAPTRLTTSHTAARTASVGIASE